MIRVVDKALAYSAGMWYSSHMHDSTRPLDIPVAYPPLRPPAASRPALAARQGGVVTPSNASSEVGPAFTESTFLVKKS